MLKLKEITNKVMRLAVGTFVFSFLFGNFHLMSGQETGNLPTRDQIETKYKWNLLDIYETEDLWEADFKWVDGNISKYSEFEGKLGNSPEDLLKCLKFDEEMGIKFSRLYLYTNLAGDLDLSNSRYQAMSDRMSALGSKYAAATSYINPEILLIPEDK
ncbi:MAG: hypothetical protein JXA68_08700, partial [Ignavibacteriales bacterium]|nr:hypothetical protein [Ignavibacteriales bacterium]